MLARQTFPGKETPLARQTPLWQGDPLARRPNRQGDLPCTVRAGDTVNKRAVYNSCSNQAIRPKQTSLIEFQTTVSPSPTKGVLIDYSVFTLRKESIISKL